MKTIAVMGTLVTIEVSDPESAGSDCEQTIERAFEWFHRVEACCSRFDPQSELMQLAAQAGVAVPVSEMLFEVVRFALAVAEDSGGAFDPTIGHRLEMRGFNRNYRTGQVVNGVGPHLDTALDDVSYRDVLLDADRNTIMLRRPLILDLGAVAKGLAIDMAARELRSFDNYAIDAESGEDLYLAGCGPEWRTLVRSGIRHPRLDRELAETITVSNAAVCTSGDYERRNPGEDGHHIIDARTGASATRVASVTVVASTAMLADALRDRRVCNSSAPTTAFACLSVTTSMD